MSKKKLLIDARMIHASGIGVYIRNLVCQLIKEPTYNIFLLVSRNHRIDFDGVRLIKTSIPIYSLREIILLPFLVSGYDLIWSPHYNVPLFTLQVRRRLVTIHDIYHLVHYRSLTFFQKLYARLFFSLATRFSDRIITVSEFSKQEIMRYCHIPGNRISVIYNGVSETFASDAKGPMKILGGHSLPDKYILFVGNIKPNKNLGNLLKAYHELITKTAFVHKLLVVGEKEKLITGDPNIHQLIYELQLQTEVIFTGYVEESDLPGIYAGASLLVFPSKYEGFGLPVLEAFACDTPVVASNIPAVVEVAKDAALYFDPNNYLDIYQKIKQLLDDQDLGNHLRQKAGERLRLFSWEHSYQQHLDLIKGLMND